MELPFSNLVRREMMKRRIGLRALCRIVGIDPSYFSKVLANKRNPPTEEATLRQLAKVLEVDPWELIVSSGRIPQEWHSLYSNPELLQSLHRLVAGKSAESSGRSLFKTIPEGVGNEKDDKGKKGPSSERSVPGRSNWDRRQPLISSRKDFGDELL